MTASDLHHAVLNSAKTAIATFIKDYPDEEVRAFGFDADDEYMGHCFDTEESRAGELEFIKGYVPEGAPLESIGCRAYQAMGEDEYMFDFVDASGEPYDDAVVKQVLPAVLTQLFDQNAFDQLKRTDDFFVCLQFHDQSYPEWIYAG